MAAGTSTGNSIVTMISYAQNREDVLLERVFADQAEGFYLDVGANQPLWDSATKHFYERGWHGINVEPGRVFEMLVADRARDVNLNLALSDRDGVITFYEFPASEGLSTCVLAEAEARRQQQGLEFLERTVPVRTLASLCAEYVDRTIDFMSIDVEGHELPVLTGGDWKRWRPRIVIVESTLPTKHDASHHQWEHLLLENAYHFAHFNGVNRFYVRSEDAQLAQALQTPPNVLDDFIPYAQAAQAADFRHEIAQLEARTAVIPRLEAQLAEFEWLGPFSIGVARRIHELAQHHPRVARCVRRLLGIEDSQTEPYRAPCEIESPHGAANPESSGDVSNHEHHPRQAA